MGGTSILSARRDIARGRVDSVYYLTGPEEILKDEFVTETVEQVVDPGSRDFNVDIRAAGDLNAETVNALVDTLPMLAERRVAVIRGLEAWRKNSKPWQALYGYLDRPSEATVVILIHGAGHDADAKLIARTTHLVAEIAQAEAQIGWVKNRAEHTGVTLTDAAAEHLVAAVGGNLSQVAVEIDKLTAAVSTDRIDTADVERLVGIRHGETLPDWVNAVLQREFVNAIKLLDVILPQSGMTAVRMLMSLGTALLGVRLARAQLDAGGSPGAAKRAIMETLRRARPLGIGKWGDEAERWVSSARAWSAAGLDEAIQRAYEADSMIKSTTIHDPRDTLYTMLLHMAAKETS